MRCLVLLAVIAACSGSSPSSGPADAYDTARCLIAGTYGDLGTKTGTGGTVSGATTLTIVLDAGPPKDDFFLKLVPGKGAFAAGAPAPGTFTLSGADTSFLGCGVCTNIIADISPTTGPSKFYFTDSGTVTLTSVNPIAGSAANLHLVETDVASGNPVAGGCVATIAAIDFGT